MAKRRKGGSGGKPLKGSKGRSSPKSPRKRDSRRSPPRDKYGRFVSPSRAKRRKLPPPFRLGGKFRSPTRLAVFEYLAELLGDWVVLEIGPSLKGFARTWAGWVLEDPRPDDEIDTDPLTMAGVLTRWSASPGVRLILATFDRLHISAGLLVEDGPLGGSGVSLSFAIDGLTAVESAIDALSAWTGVASQAANVIRTLDFREIVTTARKGK